MCLVERTRDGVILAREAADDHLDVGDFNLTGFSLLQDLIDIFVNYGIFAKAVQVQGRHGHSYRGALLWLQGQQR